MVCLGAGAKNGRLPAIHDRVLGCHAAVLVSTGSGHLCWSSPSVRLDFDAPLLFFLRPGLRHSYAPDGGGWSERWVLFDGDATRAYTSLGFLPADRPFITCGEAVPVARVLDRLVHTCGEARPHSDVEAAALMHELLVTVHRVAIQAPVRPSQAAILTTLQANACTTRSVPDHARDLGLSVKALRAAVHLTAGCSPKELILRTRLNEAKGLLAESRASIARVARMVGYDDPAYFSRIFTRRVGVTPRDFRRQESR